MRVRYRGREFVLDDAKKELTMGRAEENDIVHQGHPDFAPARENRSGRADKFVLVDQSTNGTFVHERTRARRPSCAAIP